MVLTAALLSAPLRAQTQTVNAITPFSWPEFKADYGLPSTPTTLDDSDQTDGTTTASSALVTYPLATAAQIRAYVLGNKGITLPPAGDNNFLDLEAGVGDTLDTWIGPFNGDTAGASQSIIVDDDNNLNSVTFYPDAAAVTPLTTVFGYFTDTNWTLINNTTAPTGTNNYNGDTYQRVQAVSRSVEDAGNGGTANTAHWYPYITTPGYYTIYAWFPSQNLTATTPEPHVTDARYTVYVGLAGKAPVSYSVTVSQVNGGTWVPIGGPYELPQTSQNFSYTQNGTTPATLNYTGPTETSDASQLAFVSVKLDDTTSHSLTQTINNVSYNNEIVADAIELRSNDGISTRSLGTPVAVNITPPILSNYSEYTTTPAVPAIPSEVGTVGDYKEIALGYGGGAPGGDGKVGGLPISYVADQVTGTGATEAAIPNPQYFNGSVGYNTTATSNVAPVPSVLTSLPVTLPIDQVVYYTRTETVNTDPNNPLQTTQVGFLYCANGTTGDVIWRFPNTAPSAVGDTDPVLFTPGGFNTGDTANVGSSYDGETYSVATGTGNLSATAGATATWAAPPAVSGRYFVYVWFPEQGNGETYVPDAQYTINDGSGSTTALHACNVVNQQNGGRWVQLVQTSGTNQITAFNFTPGTAAVTLSNISSTTNLVVADAVEFVPALSMSTTDSTPAVVRNMKVWDTVSKTYLSRTVVIAADNAGKVYCVDASGNGDGNDMLLDANNNSVYIDANGLAHLGSSTGSLATMPLHPTNIGSTHCYWIWQPDTAEPFGVADILDPFRPGVNSVSTGGWTLTADTNSYNGSEDYQTAAVARTAPPTTTPPGSYFTYQPLITTAQQGSVRILVWDPGLASAVTDAEYTVVDSGGNQHVCNAVNQTVGPGAAGGPGWVSLVDSVTGQSTFTFSTTPNTAAPGGWATEPNTIVLDNTTAGTISTNPQTVAVAGAIELVFTAGNDANSDLIGPLAFGTCSPTVHVTKILNTGLTTAYIYNSATYGGSTTSYDEYAAKIYIGNSNGVLYALDGAGQDDAIDPFQRDFSQDSTMPSPAVDWWFNVGVTSVDAYGEITEAVGPTPDNNPQYYISEAIAGAPAYYHPPASTTTNAYDQILFTTYSPQGTNSGRLYSVNAQGPVGYYGAGLQPDAGGIAAYQDAAGVPDYNLSPIPFYSFPDGYGQLHLPNSTTAMTLPVTDHLVTTQVPSSYGNGLPPPAHALGDAAGSPAIFGVGPVSAGNPNGLITVPNPNGGASLALQQEVYFPANDPTSDGSAATEGRIWGVNLATGTVDAAKAGVNTYVYPNINPEFLASANPGAFDPNIIPLTDPDITGQTVDYITSIFNTQDTTNNYNTLQFGPFSSGPVTFTGSAIGYYTSSSPAVGIVHTIPSSAGTLTDTLIGGDGYAAQYGGATGAYNIDVPMLYIGDDNGVLHSLNIAGYNDPSRFIQDATLDGSAIISTPALLANGNGADISNPATGNDAGGVLFVTTSSGSLWESEAFPFIENGLQSSAGGASTLARNVDFEYGGPGGFSSVASASYNIDNFQFVTAQSAGNPTGTISSGTTQSVDTSEWVYVSGDNGFTYGLTPNNTALGNGGTAGTFNPVEGESPISVEPLADNDVPLNRNIFTSVFTTPPFATGAGSTSFSPTNGRPPNNPVFDWGQTVYIAFYGLDNPNQGSAAGALDAVTANTPRGLQVTFNIGSAGSTAYGPGTQTKTIDLQTPGIAVPISQDANWPPAGYVLTSTLTGTSEQPAVGDYAAIYAFQLGNASSGDPQTPGSKIEILGVKEQAQYYAGVSSGSPTLVTTIITARSTAGTIIREANPGGNPPYTDVAAPGVDQATFSILNPLAIRTAARSMGGNPLPAWYNMALSSSSSYTFGELGPFSGVPTGSAFSLEQPALANGNSVPESAPNGGTLTNSTGIINGNDPLNSKGNALVSVPSVPVIMAIAPGMISHGTDGNSSTINPTGLDPTASAAADAAASQPTSPGNSGPGDYGSSMLDIADRSGLGDILEPITNLTVSQASLTWNDNSGAGGGQSVVNPLRWEQIPTAGQPSGSSSVDYPNIPKGNTSFETLPRTGTYNTALSDGSGTDTIASLSPATLPVASTTSTAGQASNPSVREVYPASTLVRVQVPKFQPANLDSYDAQAGGLVKIQGSTRFSDANWYNVANGYLGSFKVYVNTAGAKASQKAFRTVQVWVSIPVDQRTAITEQSVDIGSVPAGFGINLSSSSGSPIDNTAWSPFNPGAFQTSNPLSQFYKPITIVNEGNTNLLNMHLNQFIAYNNSNPVPNAFGSYAVSGLSTIPSFDVPFSSTVGSLSGTPYEPLVRSSLDDFPGAAPGGSPLNFNVYFPNAYITGSTTPPPGPTLHKARPGDVSGTIATVPDVPYRNLPGDAGSYNLTGLPYGGRPVVSLAIPLGTPVGTYSQTITAFEGSDPTSSVFEGPAYAGQLYTNNGWMAPSAGTGATGYAWALGVTNSGTTAEQQQSNPGTTLIATVIENRQTDGPPLPVINASGTYNSVLPGTDTGVSRPNSNDLQPWAFYDPSANSVPTFGLLWGSARNAKTGNPSAPYSLYGSAMIAPDNLLNTPTSGGNSWWSPASQLTEGTINSPITSEASYAASTYLALNGGSTNALWVTSQTSNTGSIVYSLNVAPITYSGNTPQLGSVTALFYSSEPIFSPRAQWFNSGQPGTSGGFTPNQVNGNPNTTTYPLIVFYMRVGGRSTLMYWPSTSAANGTPMVAAAPIPVPAGLSSASSPSIVPRPANANGVYQVDIVYSGTFGTGGNADILTGRYALNSNSTNGTATLTETGAMGPAYATAPTSGFTYPVVYEPLSRHTGQTWQSRDVAWLRDPNAFELTMAVNEPGASGVNLPLIPPPNGLTPAPPTAVYDRASGQWIFTINWNYLLSEYSGNANDVSGITAVANWWAGGVNNNIVAYVDPNSGAITFSTPLPSSSVITGINATGPSFVGLGVTVNPQVLRATFQSKSNTAPIAFIDTTTKPNAALGQPNISTSRYWVIYRKQSLQNGVAGAASSVLYFNTRRLTIVLPYPIVLQSGTYTIPPSFAVTDSNGNNVTAQVDVDWSRGRIYFPDQISAGGNRIPSEGQMYTVTYPYLNQSSNTVATGTTSGIATWQDEPMVNTPTQASVIGEHVLPISTAANESEPSAFLDPMAGSSSGGVLNLNSATVTPASLNQGNFGQPYAHKVWVFWTSTRNAAKGAGSDIYWETIDPRFEVTNP
jgi:hypothetical protein